jgi:hypothetical protein
MGVSYVIGVHISQADREFKSDAIKKAGEALELYKRLEQDFSEVRIYRKKKEKLKPLTPTEISNLERAVEQSL